LIEDDRRSKDDLVVGPVVACACVWQLGLAAFLLVSCCVRTNSVYLLVMGPRGDEVEVWKLEGAQHTLNAQRKTIENRRRYFDFS
jgi:hypothetical protein